jgi:opacity protein-like surface antigen
MKKFGFALTAALLAAGSAQAQLLAQPDPPPPTLTKAKPFSLAPQPLLRFYGYNETSINAKLFDDYRTDPKFFVGVDFTPNLAVEMGYVNLLNRGFHAVDYGRADERAGALGLKDFSSYLAGKFTVPVDERFAVYAKLGVAHSERTAKRGVAYSERTKDATEIDVGPYVNVGAEYKLSDKASVTGEFARYGDTAKKWGSDTNATGATAKLKLGF